MRPCAHIGALTLWNYAFASCLRADSCAVLGAAAQCCLQCSVCVHVRRGRAGAQLARLRDLGVCLH